MPVQGQQAEGTSIKVDNIYLFIYLLTLFNFDSRIKIHSFLI